MARFATTRWSLILDARDPAVARDALEEICRAYRGPVLVYVLRRGYAMADAEDLTQEFFTRFLESRWHEVADPARGHFRGLLLTALKRFLISASKAANTQKRGGGMFRMEGDSEVDCLFTNESDAPDEAFEHAWAMTVLERSFARLRAEAESAGKAELFRQLSPHIGEPPLVDEYQRIGAQLGLRTNTVAVAVHRLRTRLRDLVHEELADICDGPDGVAAELRALREALNRTRARSATAPGAPMARSLAAAIEPEDSA
ncbi:MAG TPA: ECF-type sigma factor [Lysobacter sp.]|jgi:RNA polymerase sigma-70 factor (ECF subfamily)|nr:ECF-type sigma factor [Lysobacter sp.]